MKLIRVKVTKCDGPKEESILGPKIEYVKKCIVLAKAMISKIKSNRSSWTFDKENAALSSVSQYAASPTEQNLKALPQHEIWHSNYGENGLSKMALFAVQCSIDCAKAIDIKQCQHIEGLLRDKLRQVSGHINWEKSSGQKDAGQFI